MPSRIGHLKYYFIAAFFVLSAAITAYEWLYAIPQKKCEAAGNWWAPKWHTCANVMTMVDGRHKPVATEPSAEPASASAASGHP